MTSVQASSWCGSHLPPSIVSMKWRSIESPGLQRDVVAALHHAGAAAFAEQALGGDGDVEIGIGLVRMQRGEQAGAAGAENQNVGLAAVRRSCRSSEHPHQERRKRRSPRRPTAARRQLLLPVAPGEILDHQHAQAAQQMNGQQEHQAALGELHQRLIGPAQEAVQRSPPPWIASPSTRKCSGRKHASAMPGKPMHQGGEPQRAARGAVMARCASTHQHHGSNGAQARAPPAAAPNSRWRTARRARSRSGDHSASNIAHADRSMNRTAATKSP